MSFGDELPVLRGHTCYCRTRKLATAMAYFAETSIVVEFGDHEDSNLFLTEQLLAATAYSPRRPSWTRLSATRLLLNVTTDLPGGIQYAHEIFHAAEHDPRTLGGVLRHNGDEPADRYRHSFGLADTLSTVVPEVTQPSHHTQQPRQGGSP